MKNKNPFKSIESTKEVPGQIKEAVLADVASMQLIKDLGDLFFVKYPMLFKSLLTSSK
jgi:hypothetical protein